jgi:hypothetical protein
LTCPFFGPDLSRTPANSKTSFFSLQDPPSSFQDPRQGVPFLACQAPTSHGKSGQADIGLKPASNPSPLEGIRSGAPAARLLQGRSQGSRDYMTSMLPLETRCLSVSRNQAVLTVQRSVLLSFGGVPLNASLRFLSLYFSHVGIHIHTYITLL